MQKQPGRRPAELEVRCQVAQKLQMLVRLNDNGTGHATRVPAAKFPVTSIEPSVWGVTVTF